MSERAIQTTRDAVTVALFAAVVGGLGAWLVLACVVHAPNALLIAAACLAASFAVNVGINLYRIRRRRR
jgi:hypothetical protein